ncbi:MAG: sel1 repeat family protein [Gammaproteobacteria bacterium]|nr:sel1 repeat family protein [Gammaproteobacteria bacterium]
MLLAVLVFGVLVGLGIGAFRWRREVIRLNGLIQERDRLPEVPGAEPARHVAEEMPTYEYGLKLYRVNKFAEAFPTLLQHAKKGHPRAMALIAKMYFVGNGVDKDEAQYKYWLGKSAEAGDKSAKAKSKRL